MYKKLSYIFSKRDKYKIALLLCIMVAGSFLELLGVAVFQPFVNIVMMRIRFRRIHILRGSIRCLDAARQNPS